MTRDNDQVDAMHDTSGIAHSEQADIGPGTAPPRGFVVAVADHADLVEKIQRRLSEQNLEIPVIPINQTSSSQVIANAHAIIMKELGLDLRDDSLNGTPSRIAKMYLDELMYGLDYRNFPKCTVFENKAEYDEMLLVKDIPVRSMCEHHFLPFIGTASIAYIPDKKFLGLSKFNRVIDFFSRRPQVQERLTEQISAAFQVILETEDVAVVIKAEHYCTKLRGAKDDAETISSKLCGRFRTVPELRSEFLAFAR